MLDTYVITRLFHSTNICEVLHVVQLSEKDAYFKTLERSNEAYKDGKSVYECCVTYQCTSNKQEEILTHVCPFYE